MPYTIGSNMPGYMPDAEPYTADNLEDAKECLAEDITHYLEDMNLDDRFSYQALHVATENLKAFDAAKPQECNVYIGNLVFWITQE